MIHSNQIKQLFEANRFPYPVISGPCSVESYNQMKETIIGLQQWGINTFRAGVWKPRTRPNSFEGLGEEGLVILERLKEEHQVKVGVELPGAANLNYVLKHKLDFIWVGARTSASPFAMHEIAEAMRGVSIPVFVKNPIAEDLSLWLGGIERIMKTTAEHQVGAIHRGFHRNGQLRYRNDPAWETLKEFRTKMPGIFMLNDPSHIAGDTRYIKEVIEMAICMGVDGFMIEAHASPETALTDKMQQLHVKDLGNLFPDKTAVPANHTLQCLRSEIDLLDQQLYDTIRKRMFIVDQVAHYKRENELPALDVKRLDEISRLSAGLAEMFNLDISLCRDIIHKVHEYSLNRQNSLLTGKDSLAKQHS
jgi:chorismate mutase